ncbi:unnamed protein product [Owenia fusiformis]|nr:unnamed protein product [Owenia fusiformis]
MWNNMKYGWAVKIKTNYSYETPVWFLGKVYSSTPQERDEDIERYGLITSMEEFKQDFSSRIWFTYRQGFPPLPKSTLTTDLGWGCMLRTGQMMLAQAFVMHFLGRDWNCWKGCTDVDRVFHRQIIRWFGDMPGDHSPFSIHNLVHYGLRMGKQAGDWYGPSSVAHVLKEAMDNAPIINPLIGDICLYVAQDCTVYVQDIVTLCTQRRRSSTSTSITSDGSSHSANKTTQQTEKWRSVIILIPVRLGGAALNVIYIDCIKALLAIPGCLGIIGGKPKHSLYFLGWQDDKLVYLDPHCSQDVVDTRSRDYDTRTFHCMSPRKLSIEKMDPSCTIGFYCKNKEDFDEFVVRTQEVAFPPMQKDQYPMFIFSNGMSSDVSMSNSSGEEVEKVVKVRHIDVDRQGNVIKTSMKESEDFVFLS